ncbi:MAG: hypothetical protein PHG06_05785 [Parabacteroides sp.]|nr:hypothetical protein [Parabacteroides sp.]
MRVLLSSKPKSVVVKDAKGKVMKEAKLQWDARSCTGWLTFENSPEGVHVIINR